MDKKTRVSVVIPTLNEEKYIDMTLFHISRQKPFEIILGDSNSSDKTVQIARKYGAKVVTCPRGMPSFGRNAAAREAKGDIILFLDADTIAYPNMLETIIKDFKNKKIVGWTCSFYAFSPKQEDHLLYIAGCDLIRLLLKTVKPHAAGFNIAVRRNIFEKVGGFDENLKVMEDHELVWRISEHGKFKFSNKTCVFSSARRLGKWGMKGLLSRYSRIYLGYILNRKRFDSNKVKYEPVR